MLDTARCTRSPFGPLGLSFLVLLALAASRPHPAAADPGDPLTSFGISGYFTEGTNQGHLVEASLLHPQLGLLLAIAEPQTLVTARIRILRLAPDTGAVLQSMSFSQIVVLGQLKLADDGDGGVIVGATVLEDATGDLDLFLFRLGAGLAIDQDFDFRQIAFDVIPNGRDELEDLAVLPDGRIVALATVERSNGRRPGLAYLLSDGSLDPTLDNGTLPDGLQIVPFQPVADIDAASMAVDSLGRVTVGGVYNSANGQELAFGRLLADAAVDTTFGTGGTQTFAYQDCVLCPPIYTAEIVDMEMQDDRPLVVVTPGEPNENLAVGRLNDSGFPDLSFGYWNRFGFEAPPTSPMPGMPMSEHSPDLEVDPTRPGFFVAARATDGADGGQFVGLARFTVDGAADTTYGDGGEIVALAGTGVGVDTVSLAIDGFDPLTFLQSNAYISFTAGVSGDVSALAFEGYVESSIFVDGFETGDLSGWSSSIP